MKNFNKLLTLLLVLLLILQSTALTIFAVEPIDTSVDSTYAASSTITSYSTKYNSGTRGVVATTLNGTGASAYYTSGYDFDTLSALSSSALLSSLRTLMKTTHKKQSSYTDCKNMAKYTDCQNEDGSVVLLYTSYVTTASTFNASSPGWNREHVWPQSLGGFSTSGPGADLHHIRPDNVKTNGTRGNKLYGNVTNGSEAYGDTLVGGISGGTFSSNYFEPLDEVKGDVARICLYIYVRYGGDYDKCSKITNVFQSIDVLLEWCELDPVDTWELGRNEVVAAYQGNRNVFIDYPEYAWLIFGRDVPDDMSTPSGEASNGILGGGSGSDIGGNTGDNTGDSTDGNNGNNNGGNNSGSTTVTTPSVVTSPTTGTAYKFGMNQTKAGGTYYLAGGMDSKNNFYMATTSDVSSAIDVYLESTDGGYYLYTLNGSTKSYINSIAVTGDDGNPHVNAVYSSTASTVYKYDTTLNTLTAEVSGKTYALGTRNDRTYTTVGPVDTSKSPFVCQFYATSTSTDPVDPIDPVDPVDPVDPTTAKEILDAAYALSSGGKLDGTYTLTGVITALDSYNNPTIVVGNYTSQPMYCYRLTDDRFELGATITVTGNIQNYNGLIEMYNCTLDSFTAPSTDPDTPDNPDNPDTPDTPTDTAVTEFVGIVTSLNGLKGTQLYSELCAALSAYGNLTDAQKEQVSTQYTTLLTAVAAYNNTVESVNSDAQTAAEAFTSNAQITTAALFFAVYDVFCKKYV